MGAVRGTASRVKLELAKLLSELNQLEEVKKHRQLSTEEAHRYELLLDVLLEFGRRPLGGTAVRGARVNSVLEVSFGTQQDFIRPSRETSAPGDSRSRLPGASRWAPSLNCESNFLVPPRRWWSAARSRGRVLA